MKISPVAGPANAEPNTAELGQTVNVDRIARAKAAFAGQDPNSVTPSADPQIERAQNAIKRIKLNTQRSTNRSVDAVLAASEVEAVANTDAETLESTPSDSLAASEPTADATEATKPLSPQFAALAKAKRAAQAKEAAILAKEQAFAQKEADMKAAFDKLARLKANPLSVLQEEGVTYDQLTESLLSQNQGTAGIDELKAEIKAMKEGFERQQAERDQQVERQVMTQIRKDVDQLISQGDDYEMVREAGYGPKVVELMQRVFKETGELLDTAEAAQLVENELIEESLRFAKLNKIRSRLTTQEQTQLQAAQQARAPAQKVTRTLTSRDGASAPMSARERAIAAFYGKLK